MSACSERTARAFGERRSHHPDASVILKWVLDADDEPYRAEARELLHGWQAQSLDLRVPSLWIYEVGNILSLKRPEEAGPILESLRALEIPEAMMEATLCRETVSLAVEHGITFYDASYVAIAELHGGILVTADSKLVRKLPKGSPVKSLEELKLELG